MDLNEGKSAPWKEPVLTGSMTSGQRHYEAVSSIISGYGRQLPEWEELREADQRKLEAAAPQAVAPRLVTVLSQGGRDTVPADDWKRRDDGGLTATRDGVKVAEFAGGGWHGVLRAFGAEAEGHVLRDVEGLLCGPGPAEDKVRAANRRLSDWRTGGE